MTIVILCPRRFLEARDSVVTLRAFLGGGDATVEFNLTLIELRVVPSIDDVLRSVCLNLIACRQARSAVHVPIALHIEKSPTTLAERSTCDILFMRLHQLQLSRVRIVFGIGDEKCQVCAQWNSVMIDDV